MAGKENAPTTLISSELAREYLRLIDAILLGLDADGTVTYVNEKGAQLLGRPAHEIIGSTWLDEYIPEHARRDVTETFRSVVAGNIDAFHHTNPIVSADGNRRMIEWRNTLLYNPDGTINRVLSVGLDITDREESQRRLSTLMDNLPGLAYRCMNDQQWTMKLVSGGCRELTGYEPDELINNRVISYGALIHPDDHNVIWQEVQAAIRKERQFQLEYRLVGKNGQQRWVWERGRSIQTTDGFFLEGFITDITARRSAEQENLINRQQQQVLNDLLIIGLETECLGKILERCLDRLLLVDWLSILPKGAIFITDQGHKTLRMAAHRNLPETLLQQCERVEFGVCLCGRAAKSHEIQYAHCLDERHDITYQGMPDHGHYNVPLMGDDRVMGVLALYLAPGHRKQDSELRFLSSVGSTMAGIIQRHQAEAELLHTRERLELVTEGASDGMWDWNMSTDKTWTSARFKELLGYADDELDLTLQEWERRLHPNDQQNTLALLQRHLQEQHPYDVEYRLLVRDGSYHWFRARGRATRDPEGNAVRMAGTVQDIHAQKEMEHKINHDSLHDPLTGLPNRTLLLDRIRHAKAMERRHDEYRAVLLLIDLDRFRLINDSLGPLLGDHLLSMVGRRLNSCIQSGDTLARLGGDEFALLLEDIESKAQLDELLGQVLHRLGETIHLDGHNVSLTASIGIAFIDASDGQGEEVLRDADTALIHAKQKGGNNQVTFDQNMRVGVIQRMETETSLRQALEQEQFELFYQPIMDLTAGSLVGMEALIRWRHPERGLISPMEFIPVAEETGMILAIGQWTLAKSCNQLMKWQKRLSHADRLFVSVNLSPKQLDQADLLEQISHTIDESGMDSRNLRLEITEGLLMEKAGRAAELLPALKDMGIKLSMDDFGTGYSSLSYLHNFPLDVLKIDRTFISRLTEDPRSADLVGIILELAKKFRMQVIAEGVETERQAARLHALGCSYAQGFHYSEPVPADIFERNFLHP
jgi:diguanylate cyclase (GGDEF)-like protein/PAS domain S-box-containing protein